MLTLQDCIGYCGLTPEQLHAIADHEHIPDMVAVEWAETMLAKPNGEVIVESIIADEIAILCAHGDIVCAERYRQALEEFMREHPR
ncbi:hypothetical protein [Telmatospirillum sp. J64-1]|uniref:hypothetical protein n=1 Tax=Telmatospirillum sp. J64-1 TaxID=2502183 RepID=UPI00115DFDD6|nr:hypothetical protein [Telmatospirillum sp. J64-1]